MFKLFGWFVALVVGGLVVMYFQGGFSTYDPGKVGADVQAAIKTGMTWTQVLDVAEPGKYQIIMIDKKKVDGRDVEEVRLGQLMNFDRGLFENDAKAKAMPDGFVFQYVYTHQIAFKVTFDGTGTVALIENMKTVADLLQTRK